MTSYRIISGATFINLETLCIVGIIYLCLTYPLSKLVGVFEKRMSGDKGYKKRKKSASAALHTQKR